MDLSRSILQLAAAAYIKLIPGKSHRQTMNLRDLLSLHKCVKIANVCPQW